MNSKHSPDEQSDKQPEGQTVAQRIRAQLHNLTRAERQLANFILEDYPIRALGSITSLSKNSHVSNPTIVRMAKKLDFTGFSQLQNKLRSEVEATISNPITRHDRWAQSVPDTHLLNRFGDAAMENIRQTLSQIDPSEFDAIAALLSDNSSHIHIVGGRITRSLADYFFTHLQMIRDGLTLVSPNINTWPHYILSMNNKDILVLFDIRRYEREISRLGQKAHEQGLTIILFTDQWGSPISKYADYCLNLRTQAPSAWDSNMMIMFIVEALIATMQNENWSKTRKRMDTLEEMFDKTGLFKKFI